MKRVMILSIITTLLLTGCCKHERWNDADCTTPKTCADCGKTEGEPAGHDWEAADCQNPKTCKNCGETEGEAGGHSTHRGKCAYCGEFDVSEIELPTIDSYKMLRLLEDVETNPTVTVVKRREASDIGGVWKIYVNLEFQEEQKMDGGSNYSWYLAYDPGTTSGVLDYEGICWDMPADDAKPAYQAIKAYCEKLYGTPVKTNYASYQTATAAWKLGDYYLEASLTKTNNIGVDINRKAPWN